LIRTKTLFYCSRKTYESKRRFLTAKLIKNLATNLGDGEKNGDDDLGVSEKRENMVSLKCEIQLKELNAAPLLFRGISIGS
jgi:fructose-1,6-bisphosphatase/sedoheptulose 1,7-bisphosphatase-like protein